MWDAWWLVFPLGIVTGVCLSYIVRSWRQAWKRTKVSTDKLRAELRERG